ncbi:MAG: DUF72 domain-containing protein [Deltaproteobacteria bacterium]|nr:DUF72 domain-containing protein [Deltaproteobacteria bacterium]
MGELVVGTSGYSYPDWVGTVYPAGTRRGDFLTLYPERLGGIELNYTYYRMPSVRSMEALASAGRGRFRFAVKLTELFTHRRTAGPGDAAAFREAMEPLRADGTLGCLLAQFPYSFRPTRGNLRYMTELLDAFAPLPRVVEVRHADWIHPGLFEVLAGRGVGFCNIDGPRLPGLPEAAAHATSPVGYVRFHGRNAARWWDHQESHERYDYLYSRTELEEWVPRIRALMEETETLFVFYNNHFRGQAVRNALDLLDLLGPDRC